MRTFSLLFMSVLVIWALTFNACTTSDTTRTTTLSAGAAEAVITRVKDNPEVYDDLYARALVLDDERQRLAIVTVDIGSFENAYIELLLEAINEFSGISTENIIINASHTHNAPGVDERVISPESEQWLTGRIAELVKSAADNLQPATLRVGREAVQIGYNRRLPYKDSNDVWMEPNPKDPIVPWVDVLSAYDEDGKQIGVLFSHAAHPVIIHWSSRGAIGPDYPGFAIKHLKRIPRLWFKDLPADILRDLLSRVGEPEGVFMFAQGCCANINGYPLSGGIEACDAAGLSLAFAVTRALEEDQIVTSGPLKARSVTLSLPLLEPPSVAECEELLVREPDNIRYQDLLKIAQSGEPQFKLLSMRALAIGEEMCILTFSGEMFAEYQLFVDEASPFKHTFVFGLTNGLAGYIATKKDYELGPAGGYEPWGHPTRYPPWLPPQPLAEELIQEGIMDLLSELKSVDD